jgi:tetratricopeptide (TPR) repeat protein
MEYKRTILVTCFLILLVLIGKELVLYYIDQREKATGAEFATAGSDQPKLRAFIAAHPDHKLTGLAWLALGDAAFKDTKYADATAAYSKAVTATAGSVFAGRARLWEAFSQARNGDSAKAEASLKAILSDPAMTPATRAEARYHLGVIAAEAGRYEEARKLLDEVEAADTTGMWAMRSRGIRSAFPPAPAAGGTTLQAPSSETAPKIELNLPGSK